MTAQRSSSAGWWRSCGIVLLAPGMSRSASTWPGFVLNLAHGERLDRGATTDASFLAGRDRIVLRADGLGLPP